MRAFCFVPFVLGTLRLSSSGDAKDKLSDDESGFGFGDTGTELNALTQILGTIETTTKGEMNKTHEHEQEEKEKDSKDSKHAAASSLSEGLRGDLEKARSEAASALSPLDPELKTLTAADVEKLHAEHRSSADAPDDSVLMDSTKKDLDGLQDLATPEDVKLNRLLREQGVVEYSVRQAAAEAAKKAAPSSFVEETAEETAVPQDFVDSMKRMSLMDKGAMRDISLFGDDKPEGLSFLDKGSAKQFDPDADLKRLEKEREEYMRTRPRRMAAPSSLLEKGSFKDMASELDRKIAAINQKMGSFNTEVSDGPPTSFLQVTPEDADHAAKRTMLMDLTAKMMSQVATLKAKLGKHEPNFDLAGLTSQFEKQVAEKARAGVHALQGELVAGRKEFLKNVAPMLHETLGATSFVEQKAEAHAASKAEAEAQKPPQHFADYDKQFEALQEYNLGSIHKIQKENADEKFAEEDFKRRQHIGEGLDTSRPSGSFLEEDDTPSLMQSSASVQQTSGASKLESKYMAAFHNAYASELDKALHPEKNMRTD
jgi:hypothetical protein